MFQFSISRQRLSNAKAEAPRNSYGVVTLGRRPSGNLIRSIARCRLPTALFAKFKARNAAGLAVADLIKQLFSRERSFATGTDIARQFSQPANCALLVEGVAAQYRILSNGRRQITSVLVPGDFVNLHSMIVGQEPYSVLALGICRVLVAEAEQFRSALSSSTELGRILWMETLAEAAIQRESIVSMGRRTALGHLAHFICELHERVSMVGEAAGNSFQLPLTQSDLADALGLSVVHVNRLLKTMRSDGLLSWSNSVVSILNEYKLREIAEFDPTYLGFRQVRQEGVNFSEA